MISYVEYFDVLSAAIPTAIMGIAASIIRTSRYGWKGFRHFIAGTLTSVFVGVITGWMLELAELPATVVTAIVCMSSYFGATLLDAVLWRADKEIRTCKIPGIQSADEAPKLEEPE